MIRRSKSIFENEDVTTSARPSTMAVKLESDSQSKDNLINAELLNIGLNVKKY